MGQGAFFYLVTMLFGQQKHFAYSASLAQTTGVILKYLIRAASGINYSAILHSTLREKEMANG